MKYNDFTVLVCGYNNERWVEQNLRSILDQDYPRFRVIYTDDCSTDQTVELGRSFLGRYDSESRVRLVSNTSNRKPLANIYHMAHSCHDDDILVTVDGDDWLPHKQVLSRLNEVYQDDQVWMTWGSYMRFPSEKKGLGALPLPEDVIRNHAYRRHRWSLSHLRTFRSWLFKKIDRDDLQQDGQFFQMAGDLAFMFPMAEMCAGRFRYLDEILYVYNEENPLQEHKLDEPQQLAVDAYIRSKTPYQRINDRHS